MILFEAHRRTAIAVATAFLAVTLAACGGSSSPTATETPTPEPVASPTETESTDDGSAAGLFTSEECQTAALAFGAISSGTLGALSGGLSAKVKKDIAGLDDYVDKIPDSLKDDFETVSDAYGDFVTAIKASGYQLGTIPTSEQAQAISDAVGSLQAEEFTDASKNINDYFEGNCQL